MQSVKDMWERLQEKLAERKKVRQAINELSKLNDFELNDIGINRSMIRWVANGGRRHV